MSPGRLWSLSRRLHARGWHSAAGVVKALNFFAFHCVLPPEVEVQGEVRFLHHALGVVLDPSVRIIGPVLISQHVTIGTGGGVADAPRVTLEDCFIGAGATVLAPRNKSIHIGPRAAIGASAHVVADVPAGHRVGAPPAVTVRVTG